MAKFFQSRSYTEFLEELGMPNVDSTGDGYSAELTAPHPAVCQHEELIDDVIISLGLTESLSREYIRIALSDIALFDRKQHDYGSENIASFGEFGVLVRSNDKIARLRHLYNSVYPVANESVEDSWCDQSVYGVIARMCRAGTWPGVGTRVELA